MAEKDRFMLSDHGIQYFIEDAPSDDSTIMVGTHEIEAVTKVSIDMDTKEVTTHKATSNSVETSVMLDLSKSRITFDCLNMGDEEDNNTFTHIKNWMGEQDSAEDKLLFEVMPLWDGTYAGRVYHITPKWYTEDSQEFSFTVGLYSKTESVIVTHDESNDTFTFEKK